MGHSSGGKLLQSSQQSHKGQGSGLVVIGRLANVIAEGQAQGCLLVVEAGRQHAGGVEQVEVLAQPHPAQAASHTGAAGAVYDFLTHQPIDQGRFAHIGEAQHQRPHRPRFHAPASPANIEG